MATNKRLIKSNDEGGALGLSFNTVLYIGNSSTQDVTGVGFQPDLVWIKARSSAYSHRLFDSVRGATKILRSNETIAEGTDVNTLTSFQTDGFNLGNEQYVNGSGIDFVAWCWKAGGAAVTNTDGTITSQVSANPAAGFSIVSWTSNYYGDVNGSVGHGLGVAPDVYIVKKRNNTSQWYVYAQNIIGNNTLKLNTTDAASSYGWISAPTETTFNAWDWSSGSEMITYCFAEVAGFSKFGSYVGTGSAGNAQTLGFEPAFVMLKTSSTTGNWLMIDNKRGSSVYLLANSANAEAPASIISFDPDGFSFTSANGNDSGVTWIYMAFANQF